MKITYNKNPLYTSVELDEYEKKELLYKIKIEQLQQLMYSTHFNLKEGKFFDLEKARKSIDPTYYCTKENSLLDKKCNEILEEFIAELNSYHVGDCTFVPCACSKCHAEYLLGIDTIPGLEKHSAYKIFDAFGKDNQNTIDEALIYLANYNPKPSDPDSEVWKKLGGYEQHIHRWKEEAREAHDWLLNYKNTYFR